MLDHHPDLTDNVGALAVGGPRRQPLRVFFAMDMYESRLLLAQTHRLEVFSPQHPNEG